MRPHSTFTWPAPSRGWITSGNIANAPLDAAERLDNYFPTAQGARLRNGATKHATLDAQVARFLTYTSGNIDKFFAATAADLFEISSPADVDTTPTPSLTGLHSGDWSGVQFGTAGGNYMVAVNGIDHGVYYDGTAVIPLLDEAVNALEYDALTGDFAIADTVTGGTSGATAEILGIAPTSATAGTLYIGAITGTFQDNEALTDGATGAATSDIPSGTSSASTITVTGVATGDLAQVWMNKERLFFVQRDTLKAWYLPVESIGGTATEINFSSIFRKGGSLMFGANWSLDSGDGMDDKCVFVTDQGEVAVYSGTDPSSASTWGLEGIYQIGAPLNKHAHFSLGGELMIVTKDGIFALSQAIARAYADVIANAITAPVEDRWRQDVGENSTAANVNVIMWHSRGELLISTDAIAGAGPVSFVANTRIGAWSRYVGWEVKSGTVFADEMYFGDSDGLVLKAETGGNDNGTAYTGQYIAKFSNMGGAGRKVANHLSLLTRATVDVKFSAKVFGDYELGDLSSNYVLPDPPGSSTWGTGEWGSAVWGGGDQLFGRQKWKSVGGQGVSLAPGIAMTSNSTAAPQIELAGTILSFEVGSFL